MSKTKTSDGYAFGFLLLIVLFAGIGGYIIQHGPYNPMVKMCNYPVCSNPYGVNVCRDDWEPCKPPEPPPTPVVPMHDLEPCSYGVHRQPIYSLSLGNEVSGSVSGSSSGHFSGNFLFGYGYESSSISGSMQTNQYYYYYVDGAHGKVLAKIDAATTEILMSDVEHPELLTVIMNDTRMVAGGDGPGVWGWNNFGISQVPTSDFSSVNETQCYNAGDGEYAPHRMAPYLSNLVSGGVDYHPLGLFGIKQSEKILVVPTGAIKEQYQVN